MSDTPERNPDEKGLKYYLGKARTKANQASLLSEMVGNPVSAVEAEAFLITLASKSFPIGNNLDIVLASWGLLDEYTELGVGERRKKYVLESGYRGRNIYNPEDTSKLKSATNNLEKHEPELYAVIDDHCVNFKLDDIMDEAYKTLLNKKTNNLITYPEPYYKKVAPIDLKVENLQGTPTPINSDSESNPQDIRIVADNSVTGNISNNPLYLVRNLVRTISSVFSKHTAIPNQNHYRNHSHRNSLIRKNAAKLVLFTVFMSGLILACYSILNHTVMSKDDVPELNKNLKVNYFSPVNLPENGSGYSWASIEIDNSEWIKEMETDATGGDLNASYLLGEYYMEHNDERAAEWLIPPAEKGYPPAESRLSYLYYYGVGVYQDEQKAKKLAIDAAKGGDISGEFLLGLYYSLGIDGETDYESALHWLLIAVEHAYSDDLYYSAPFELLGDMYYTGEGVSQDYTEALYYYKVAYDRGAFNAATHIGQMYEYGFGVAVNYDRAFEWYQEGASHHVTMCYTKIAFFYEKGISVSQDLSEAFKWYQIAAALDEPYAQKALAMFYINGEIVERDEQEGLKLLALSAEQGDEEAKELLSALTKDRW